MKNTLALMGFLLLFSNSFPANAQSEIDVLVKDWERAKSYSLEVIEAMPADQFTIKPSPEIRTFADQFLHLTDTDYAFISAATSRDATAKDLEKGTTDKSKANVLKLTEAGYDFVISALKSMDTDELTKEVSLFGRFTMTKKQAIEKAFEHQTHQRGQAIIYLRLAGATPPREQLF